MTKAEIRTTFLQVLNNTSCTEALADTFIEQGIARSQRMLKLPTQEALDEVTVGDDFEGIDIPNDALRIINVYYDGDTCPGVLTRIPLSTYLLKARSTNIPKYWTRSRSLLLLNPTPAAGTVVKVLYYSEFDSFEDDDDDTPLSIIAPDLFIYGGLCYAADHFLDERKPVFEQRYEQIVTELQSQADEDELSGGAVVANNYDFPCEDY